LQKTVVGFISVLACLAPVAAMQTPGARGGVTAPSFVRVNGQSLALRYAYALTAPDSFDPSVEVALVLMTPAALPADALAKIASRREAFALVPAGAVVEARSAGDTVFLYHKALGGQQLSTGGDSKVTRSAGRVSGYAKSFMPGDSDQFGFKVRYELTFDAPIVKRLPLTAAAPAPAASAKPPAGPLPKTQPRDVTTRMIRDAGFDMAKWRASLVREFGAEVVDAISR
jgi:hypothetical protein